MYIIIVYIFQVLCGGAHQLNQLEQEHGDHSMKAKMDSEQEQCKPSNGCGKHAKRPSKDTPSSVG